MKKKVFMIIAMLTIILIMAVCLVACGNTQTQDSYSHGFSIQGTTLVCIGTSRGKTLNSLYELYYDKDTKVMYMFVKSGYGAGLTPMYNADGTLKLYKGE